MALSDVLNRLEKKFQPSLLGLVDSSAMRQRLNEYALEKQTEILALPVLQQDKGFESWVKYRAYDDAYDYLLALPEAVDIEGEGNTKLADRKTMLAALKAARDENEADFNDLLNPSETVTVKNQPTVSVPIEVVW
jgi:hypothetical protein